MSNTGPADTSITGRRIRIGRHGGVSDTGPPPFLAHPLSMHAAVCCVVRSADPFTGTFVTNDDATSGQDPFDRTPAQAETVISQTAGSMISAGKPSDWRRSSYPARCHVG